MFVAPQQLRRCFGACNAVRPAHSDSSGCDSSGLWVLTGCLAEYTTWATRIVQLACSSLYGCSGMCHRLGAWIDKQNKRQVKSATKAAKCGERKWNKMGPTACIEFHKHWAAVKYTRTLLQRSDHNISSWVWHQCVQWAEIVGLYKSEAKTF